MKSDVEIAQEAVIKPILEIAENLGITEDELELYGKYKAKIASSVWERVKERPNGKLVLVTAINPTPAGEGKTTTSVGLADAFHTLGKKTAVIVSKLHRVRVSLRERTVRIRKVVGSNPFRSSTAQILSRL